MYRINENQLQLSVETTITSLSYALSNVLTSPIVSTSIDTHEFCSTGFFVINIDSVNLSKDTALLIERLHFNIKWLSRFPVLTIIIKKTAHG